MFNMSRPAERTAMTHEPHDLPEDDEPISMTTEERSVWVYLAGIIVSTGFYLAWILPQVFDRPIADVSWIPAMLWAIGISVGFTIVGTIVAQVGSAVGLAIKGRDVKAEMETDVRDKEIGARGTKASATVVGVGVGLTLVLTMLGADHFWIGNALYAAGFGGALAETITKVSLYRRGF